MSRRRSLRYPGLELTRSWRMALPAGGRDALRQCLILLTSYIVYDLVRIAARGREVVAVANAQHLTNAEKALHLYVEPWLQAKAANVEAVILAMNWFYAKVHLPATILILVWIYLYRNEAWIFFRNTFLAMNGLALACFALLPVAPPRLVPTSGLVDTLYLFSSSNYQSGVMSFVTNPYAALPSLHVGYALFLSMALVWLVRSTAVRVAAVIYPVVVVASIVITGNHYLLDAVGGAMVLGLAVAVACALPAQERLPEAVVATDRVRNGD